MLVDNSQETKPEILVDRAEGRSQLLIGRGVGMELNHDTEHGRQTLNGNPTSW
jgi:hypothetical protein